MSFQALFESMTEGVIVQHSSGQITYFNRAALRILGVEEAELGSTSVLQIASMAFRTATSHVDQIVGHTSAQGRPVCLSVTAVPTLDENSHSAWQVLLTFRDITEAYRNERFLNVTLNALPSLIAYLDLDLNVQYMNSAFEDWFQIKQESWKGKSIREATGAKSFEAILPQLEKARAGEGSVVERTVRTEQNEERFLRIHATPDFCSEGHVRGIYLIAHDRTHQTHLDREMRRKELELARILNSVPALIGYFDQNQVNLNSNLAYASFFKMDSDALKGRTLRELQGPELYEKNRPFVEGVLQGEPQNFERTLPMADGKTKHVLANYIPDFVDGRVTGFFIVVTDISLMKNLELDRREMEAKVISSSKMALLGEMATGVAHEVNNPLAIIGGTASFLKEALKSKRLDDEKLATKLDSIERNVSRIAKVIRGLRVFAKDAELDPKENVSANQVVQETLGLCQKKMVHKGIELQLNLEPDLRANCNSTQISHVLLNLLNNSMDAVSELDTKWIRIEAMSEKQSIIFKVIDSGTGIPAANVEKIMLPFFTTKPTGQGMGLGLSISKGIAESNGGSLALDRASQNTCFVLSLPAAESKLASV